MLPIPTNNPEVKEPNDNSLRQILEELEKRTNDANDRIRSLYSFLFGPANCKSLDVSPAECFEDELEITLNIAYNNLTNIELIMKRLGM